MPSLKNIRTRMGSVKSTQKITRAMKMVAGARLARAQQRITALRPYALKTGEVLRDVSNSLALLPDGSDPVLLAPLLHPLLRERKESKVLFLVFSSDRGLCGAFNTNIGKASEREWQLKKEAGVEAFFATVGRKGRHYLHRRGANLQMDFPQMYEKLDLDKAYQIGRWLIPRYAAGEWDAIYLIYNQFKSAITQKVVCDRLLPLFTLPNTTQSTSLPLNPSFASPVTYLYEPNQHSLFERLVPMYVHITLYRTLLESHASELGARMTAMDAATRNAKEMISRLTLMYNRARQAAITKELMEIIGGAEALKE